MYKRQPAAGGAPAAPPASPPAVQPNAYQPSRQGDAKSLYGNELPFLNPQDGTVTINGTTLNMGSFREIEARFNKYLSQPEESTEDAKEYQKIFEKLHETLSMRKEKLAADNVVRQVVDLLTAASSNPLDGGVSDALCQAIYTCLLYTSSPAAVSVPQAGLHGIPPKNRMDRHSPPEREV